MGLVIAVATIASYGAIWWILGLWGAGRGSAPTYAVGPIVLLLLIWTAWRRKLYESPERRRDRARRGYIIGIVTGAQAVLIVIALHVLRAAGHVDLLTPIVAVIVGLHFLALARLFPARAYYVTAASLVALGVVGFYFPAGSPRILAVSFAAAAILWLTCVAVLLWPESRRNGP